MWALRHIETPKRSRRLAFVLDRVSLTGSPTGRRPAHPTTHPSNDARPEKKPTRFIFYGKFNN